MLAHTSKRGFTLIEMLVVIGIIVVLVAILFPVFQTVREQSRQTACIGNLEQLVVALKQYRADHGRYPFMPYYDTGLQKYQGGFSALYPDYVDDTSLFICPDDRNIDGIEKEARARVYCSYNGAVTGVDTSDETTWAFDEGNYTHIETLSTFDGPTRWYNYYGYENGGVDPYNGEAGDPGHYPYASGAPTWLTDEGLKYKHYPRLSNRSAPDTTVITHCTHHRNFYNKQTEQMDLVMRLNGRHEKISWTAWKDPGSGTISKFVTQRD